MAETPFKSISKVGLLKALLSSAYLNFDLLVTEQRDQVRDDHRVDDHLDLLIPGVRQVGQSPHCVYQDLEAEKKHWLIYFVSFSHFETVIY